MKQAADELGINYSTAKTIVQTFRREKRVAKKPKRGLETKKALKREKYIARVLGHHKLTKILARIMEEETKDLELKPEKRKASEVNIPEASTAMVTQQPIEPPPNTPFPRITSAFQMVLPAPLEEPPMRQDCGVMTDDLLVPQICKRDVFFVHSEANPEELYRSKVDYANPVTLRAKIRPEQEVRTTPISKLPQLRPLMVAMQQRQILVQYTDWVEERPEFVFSDYSASVVTSRYGLMDDNNV